MGRNWPETVLGGYTGRWRSGGGKERAVDDAWKEGPGLWEITRRPAAGAASAMLSSAPAPVR